MVEILAQSANGGGGNPTVGSTENPVQTPTLPSAATPDSNGELERLRQENRDLQEWRQHSQNMLRRDVDPAIQETSLRTLMTKAGYSPEQIQEHFSGQGQPPHSNPEIPAENDPRDFNEQRIAQLEHKVRETRQRALQNDLTDNITRGLDTHKDIRVLLDRVAKRSPEDAAKLRTTIAAKAQRDLLSLAHQRKEKLGRFDPGWFGELAPTVLDAIASDYRMAIGDFDLIGRTADPNTQLEMSLSRRKPVDAPKFNGQDAGTLDTQLDNYTIDTLLRKSMAVSGEGSRA